MHVSEINIYPIKSCAPVKVKSAAVELEGLANDRRFMVTDPEGACMTARQWPKLLGVEASFDGRRLTLATPAGQPASVTVASLEEAYDPVTIWKDQVKAQRCSGETDEVLSTWLGTPSRLVYLGPQSHRPFRHTQTVNFADAAPLLITTQASLNRLNEDLEEPITMRRFRPNVVIDGAAPLAEHRWRRLQLEQVELEMVWACERCILTTIDEHSWTKHPRNEPLRTLRHLNRDEDGKINFGHNAVAVAPGMINVGDSVLAI